MKRAAAALMLVALATLLAWQWHRDSQTRACLDAGGAWHGAQSRCLPSPGGPILQRDLQRS